MAGYLDGSYCTITVPQETARNIRVKRDGTIAGAADRDFGITIASGQPEGGANGSVPGVYNTDVTVSLINKEGTQEATLDGDVAIDAPVYTAADGKVTATAASGSFLRGIAMQAGVDGEIIEIMPIVAATAEP